MVRDGREVFIGSQSLRGLELDRRREVGVIIRNQKIAKQIQTVFEADWDQVEDKKDKDKKDEKRDDKAKAADDA
jgi:phosphatidylserine/phosphatidylglycerophosphate/cardiolipin synthase-like enzyme